jgi:hypothetical protein
MKKHPATTDNGPSAGNAEAMARQIESFMETLSGGSPSPSADRYRSIRWALRHDFMHREADLDRHIEALPRFWKIHTGWLVAAWILCVAAFSVANDLWFHLATGWLIPTRQGKVDAIWGIYSVILYFLLFTIYKRLTRPTVITLDHLSSIRDRLAMDNGQ